MMPNNAKLFLLVDCATSRTGFVYQKVGCSLGCCLLDSECMSRLSSNRPLPLLPQPWHHMLSLL
jgi:hypothetical protein